MLLPRAAFPVLPGTPPASERVTFPREPRAAGINHPEKPGLASCGPGEPFSPPSLCWHRSRKAVPDFCFLGRTRSNGALSSKRRENRTQEPVWNLARLLAFGRARRGSSRPRGRPERPWPSPATRPPRPPAPRVRFWANFLCSSLRLYLKPKSRS